MGLAGGTKLALSGPGSRTGPQREDGGMKQLLSLAVVATLAVAGTASAQEDYRYGRLRYFEPGVTLQRSTETAAEDAVANLPFLPGDRVWTDSSGRAEFQFEDGVLVRVDSRSKLDYAAHDEGRDERVVLRL